MKNMTDHPIVTRNNKSSNFILQLIMTGIAIVLFFSIYQSLAYKTVSFNTVNISMMIGVWGLILWLEIRRRKSISIYPDYVIINSKNGHEKKFNNCDIYLNIVKHPAQSWKSTRTLQLRRKGIHRKIFSIEPLDQKDDKYLENLLIYTCKMKVDNWVK
jgi:hypothetical protein